MSDELLPYYNRELSYIRRLATQFAEAHPKIAGRLRLGPDTGDDPHVERLIEAFAYLTARVRHKLDDDFPEITEALMGVLYPHYQAPVPSLSIIQFELDPEQNQLTRGYQIPRNTEVETEPIQGEPCRFRTCYPVTLWPIELRGANLYLAPLPAPAIPEAPGAAACLHLSLRCRGKDLTFNALNLDSLRFFLRGQSQHVFRLYELIFNNTLAVALARSPTDRAPVVLDPAECLRPVGFGRDEGLLPYPARSFLGYRLLTEFFAFAPKFLFFDLAGLDSRALSSFGDQIEAYLYLDRTFGELAQNVSADTFRLGCTPMVNLYPQRADPIPLTQTDFEYRVAPDSRRSQATEVYSVDRVVASPPRGDPVEFAPFFSVRHSRQTDETKRYWYAARRPAVDAGAGGDAGTEVYLSLVDLDFQPDAPPHWTADVATTCLNRDLPARLPFGGDQPRLQTSVGGGVISRIACLTPPTPTLRPALRRGALWRLISHLSLNHLSLVDNDDQADALREILKLYDFADSPTTRRMIDGVLGVSSRRVVGNVRSGGPAAFCRGVEVTVRLDEERFTGNGVFLFAAVLERFLALYCTVNSFTKLVVITKQREGELRRWPPRAGERVLA